VVWEISGSVKNIKRQQQNIRPATIVGGQINAQDIVYIQRRM